MLTAIDYETRIKELEAEIVRLKNRDTLVEAQIYVAIGKNKGVHCPCCNMFNKRYNWKFNTPIARWLIAGYKLQRDNGLLPFKAIDAQVVAKLGGGSYSWLRHWGLVQSMGEEHSGLWSLTQKGIHFVEGKVRIPDHIIMYNNICEGTTGKEISIHEALGKKYHFLFYELFQ